VLQEPHEDGEVNGTADRSFRIGTVCVLGVAMPISDDMRDEDLEFECPNCGCLIVEKGSWLKVISAFTCSQCETRVRIGYPAKVALFERKKNSSDGAD
jgi:hypothetical protein